MGRTMDTIGMVLAGFVVIVEFLFAIVGFLGCDKELGIGSHGLWNLLK